MARKRDNDINQRLDYRINIADTNDIPKKQKRKTSLSSYI
jgi:hypothetical protein